MVYVIKLSGHHINEPVYLREFANVVVALEHPTIIVHGGGKEITAMQQKLGLEPQYVDGVRVTDAATLSVVTMILSGSVNKRLVRYLNEAGAEALGISGVDRNIVQAKKMYHEEVDMGYTGIVHSVRGDVLQEMLAQKILPVMSPICGGYDTHYNVNGDHVAGAIAAALRVDRLIYLSNISGVMANDEIIPEITPSAAHQLIADGIVTGGMIPKVETALEALASGVKSVLITNLVGLKSNRGTLFIDG